MGRRVLIIDDDQLVHDILSPVLKAMDLDVESALDGPQGAIRARELWPELIILDFEMPGGGGEAVFETLRSNERLSDVPVLFLSGLSLVNQVTRVAISRNVRFLSKPIDLAEFKHMAAELLAPPKHI